MEANDLTRLVSAISDLYEAVPAMQVALTACRAVGPESDGPGEASKATLIEGWLHDLGITDIIRCDAPDSRAECGSRPNIVATIPGASSRSLWLFAHMDVVPAGDLNLWKSDPWTVVRDGDVLYGRGVEDNQQGLVSMLLLARALKECGITPALTLRLVFMSDEETGNEKGLGWIVDRRPDLFSPEDLFIVPDGGSESGTQIEIAEKSILWLKVTVTGVQCHASTPQKGTNAFVAASDICLALTGLSKDFNETNPLFDPPRSTFVPTRHDENVAGVNILPGNDVFYVDCRLLPGISPDAVLERARERAQVVAARRGVTCTVETSMLQVASATPADAPVVRALGEVLTDMGLDPKPVGIGGGTVAAILRGKGLPAAVWSTLLSCCHEPNEHSLISNTVRDAKVFAGIVMRHVR